MKKRTKFAISEKKYLVAIPVPSLDSKGRAISQSEVDKWSRRTQRELTRCFGGATPLPAPGTNMVGRRVLYEKGQILVLAGCDDREQFLKKRERIEAFAEEMRRALDQHSVFVLALASDSFLIEMER
jgi:hypothetical protein